MNFMEKQLLLSTEERWEIYLKRNIKGFPNVRSIITDNNIFLGEINRLY